MRATPPPASQLQIALLHPVYWPEVRRGSERFIHDLGERLAARGHRPVLITSHLGAKKTSVEDGMEVIRLHRPRGRRLQVGLRDQYLTHIPAVLRELRALEPDLVHALYPVDALAAAWWRRRSGRPLVFSLMGMPRPETLRRTAWRRIIGAALGRAEASVCLSQRAATETEDAFEVTPRVIPPGVDLQLFHPDAPRSDNPTIFCPADLSDPRKRGPLLIEAFRVLRSRRPDARLVLDRRHASPNPSVAGPGVEYRDLDGPEALVRAYSEAWATVLLSDAEAFGLVLVESLACGTPVVGVRGGGAEEIIDSDAVGRLVEPQGSEFVAGAISEAMSSNEDGRPTCISRAEAFSADRCASRYEALYDEVLSR